MLLSQRPPRVFSHRGHPSHGFSTKRDQSIGDRFYGLGMRRLLSVLVLVVSGVLLSSCGTALSSSGANSSGQSFSVDQMVCPSTMFCSAEGTYGTSTRDVLIETTDEGRTWIRASVPSDVIFGASPIACGFLSACLASGYSRINGHHTSYIFYTHNAGRSWVDVANAALSRDAILSESCWSAAECVVLHSVGKDGRMSSVSTDDGGRKWTSGGFFPYPLISGLACSAPLRCLAIGGGGNAVNHFVSTLDGGETWMPTGLHLGVDILQPFLTNSISCASEMICLLGGGLDYPLYRTIDDGVTVTGISLPREKFAINSVSVSCPSSSICYAATSEGYVLKSTNGGASFFNMPLLSFEKLRSLSVYLNVISCPTKTTCVIGSIDSGSLESIFRTDNGGGSWVKESVPRVKN